MNAPDAPVRVTKTDTLLKVIEGLGTDKGDRPIGIRTKALAEATGVPANSIQALLAAHVASGRLCVCKVTIPGQYTQNEYRRGAGMPTPQPRPLSSKRLAIARSGPETRPAAPSTQAATGTLPARSSWPVTPVFLSSTTPQAQVGNSASRHAGASAETPPAGPADTAITATPGPVPKRRGMGPAAAKAPAGDVRKLRLAIDQDGSLQMGDDADPAQFVFPPEQVLQLGDFLHGTQGIWRP
jgi:hypothetical protein